MEPDHRLEWGGIWDGIPMWELMCIHEEGDPKFHHDITTNTLQTDCLVQQWFDADGLDVIGTALIFEDGDLMLFTTWNESGEPWLTDEDGYERWKEMQE